MTTRSALTAAVGLLAFFGASGQALAQPYYRDYDWRRYEAARGQEWREHQWREHQWREHEWRERQQSYYRPPPVVYGSPPGYYAPPPLVYSQPGVRLAIP